MFPIVIFAALAGLVAWAVKPKATGITGMGFAGPASPALAPVAVPALLPEQERLLSLLVLWIKDKQFAPGEKRYLTKEMADETMRLAARFGLWGTARAIATGSELPRTEPFPGRAMTIKDAILVYGTRGVI